MLTKKNVADLLFGVQLICCLIFCISQFVRMLQTTQGINVSWFLSWELFIVLNLGLAVNAHRAQPSRITRQTIVSYATWFLMIFANAVLLFWKNGSATWDQRDSITMALVGFFSVFTVSWGYAKCRSFAAAIKDPLVRGYLALALKAVPQCILAVKMYDVGGAGLAALTVINGHISILTRIGQLIFSIKEAGWDRNRIGSAISEIGNELSWLVVTIVWIFR